NEGAVGYNFEFVYPCLGGIATLVQALATDLENSIRTQESVIHICPNTKRVVTANANEYVYDILVWTGPVTKLIDCLVTTPKCQVKRIRCQQLRELASKLRHAGLQVAVLGQPHYENRFGNEIQWLYVPKGYPFHRVGWSSRVASYLAPAGCEALYVELASHQQSQVCEGDVLAALAALGVRVQDQPVDVYRSYWHEYAYPVETLETRQALDGIQGVFAEEGWTIATTGRFGAWYYDSICECIEHARQTVAAFTKRFQDAEVIR
ncbi:MAG TPA: hypothetical protein DEV81_02740, partial [Cyanobacteria bacterium UBA11049]|nr:hypothetical protein [Cyanobacteria bacterium UBA11049]